MQAAMPDQICPLCRRVIADRSEQVPTRLCQQCQLMIAPIIPGARFKGDIAPAGPQLSWQPDYAAAVIDRVEETRAAVIEDQNGFEMLELEPLDEEVEFAEEAQAAETLSYSDVELAPEAPDVFENPDDNLITEASEAVINDSDNIADSTVEEAAEEFDQQQIIADHTAPAEHIDEHIDEGAQAAVAAPDYVSAIDPWDDPLPVWDQSQNEWPGTISQEKPSKARQLRIPIAIALVAAIAAAVYFFVFGQRTATTPGDESKVEQPPLVVPSPAAEQKNAALPTAPQTPASPAQPAGENNNPSSNIGEGRFTLQIASMPNEAAANEMAAELKAGGLPAYVVAADLGKRGVWYRIRVGRFITAEEAQRFAASKGLRAEVARD
jgi:cell division septation protein DedD